VHGSLRVSTLRSLGVPEESLQGVLAWYALLSLRAEMALPDYARKGHTPTRGGW
jgi:hypothetical protein